MFFFEQLCGGGQALQTLKMLLLRLIPKYQPNGQRSSIIALESFQKVTTYNNLTIELYCKDRYDFSIKAAGIGLSLSSMRDIVEELVEKFR